MANYLYSKKLLLNVTEPVSQQGGVLGYVF